MAEKIAIQITGQETVQQALEAVQALCERRPDLRQVLDGIVPFAELRSWKGRSRPIGRCSHCGVGTVHSPGIWHLASGHLGLGGPLICDSCGVYENHKLVSLGG